MCSLKTHLKVWGVAIFHNLWQWQIFSYLLPRPFEDLPKVAGSDTPQSSVVNNTLAHKIYTKMGWPVCLNGNFSPTEWEANFEWPWEGILRLGFHITHNKFLQVLYTLIMFVKSNCLGDLPRWKCYKDAIISPSKGGSTFCVQLT
jgi:hypothetical protein